MSRTALLERVGARRSRPASPNREALAAAIKARDEARARLETLHGADLFSQLMEARDAREAAAKALADALKADAAVRTDALIAGRSTPEATEPAAHAALQAAEDEMRALETAREVIRIEVEGIERGAQRRDWAVGSAVAAVLRDEAGPVIDAMVTELEALSQAWVDKALALSELTSATFLPGPLTPARMAAERMNTAPRNWPNRLTGAHHPTLAAWQAARAELAKDAGAVLP